MLESIPWWEPETDKHEIQLLQEVIKSNFLNEGKYTELFEQEIAKLLGVRYAVALTSGTMAIFAALAALGIGHGDEVLVPDVTFIATANAVVLTGAKPVLVDIDPLTFNISIEAIRKQITPQTKAIVPVHVSGRGAAMKAILKLASEYELEVVEDAAEAFLSKYQGQYLGTFGHMGCFSFSPNKTIMTGQGGAIITNDKALYTRLKELKDQGRPIRGTGGDDIHVSVGYNFKLTNLQAAVGLVQLRRLFKRIKRQKRIREIYANELGSVSGIKLLPFDLEGGEVPQWTDAVSDIRDPLCECLKRNRIGFRKFWFPLHQQKPYHLPDSSFPVSTAMMPKAFWLPSAFTLLDEDVLKVCSVIKGFLK